MKGPAIPNGPYLCYSSHAYTSLYFKYFGNSVTTIYLKNIVSKEKQDFCHYNVFCLGPISGLCYNFLFDTWFVYLPAFVDSAYAMANGKYIPLEMEVVMETGEQFVTVRGIDATEKTDVVIYIGGNKTMRNNCVHQFVRTETVEPTHETGGYTVYECTKCKHSYKLKYTFHRFTNKVIYLFFSFILCIYIYSPVKRKTSTFKF